jgi:uncharacterized repeat protein (TIGR01451 family)
VIAQNSAGTAAGEIKSLTTSASGSQSGSQVLGTATGGTTGISTGNASSNGSSQSTSSTSGSSTRTPTTQAASAKPKVNPRPSFISLEYSLNDNGALVHVINNIRPKPGEEFSYTIVYKNDSTYQFNEATLKVLIPSEAYYVSSSIEPTKSSSNIVELYLGNIEPGSRETITIMVRVNDDVLPDTNMIFTSVLGYKDRLGTQLATTSYMTVIVGEGEGSASLSASFLSSIFGSAGMIILFAFGLIIVLGVSTYALVRIKQNGKNGKKEKEINEDMFGFDSIPPTFEPIGPLNTVRK